MKRMSVPLTHLSAALLVVAAALGGCGGKDPEKLVESARDHLQKNDTAAAVIELKNALKEKSDLPEARLMLGKVLLDSGDAVGAEAELRKARELNFKPDEVAPLLAQAWVMQGQARKAIEAFDQLHLESPKAQADLLTWVAIAWRAEGKAENFRKRLDAALQIQPDHAPALIERARFLASERKFDESISTLDGLLAREPRNAEALKLRGDVLLVGLAKQEEAQAAYQAAVDAAPKLVDAHSSLIRLLLAEGKTDEGKKALDKLVALAGNHPLTLYLQTQLALQVKDFKLAKEKSQQLLKRAPNSASANELAGVVELETGSVVQAQAMLNKALQAAPGLRVARRALVLAHLRAGQVDQAIAALPEGFTPDKSENDAGMLTVAGRAYMAKGDFARAQAFFKRAAAVDPQDPGMRTSLAVSQFMSGQADTALTELNDISAQDSGVVADMALINALIQRRDYDKALTAIGNLEKKRAQDPMPKHLRGMVMLMRNDAAGARKAFEAALSVDATYLAAASGLSALDLEDKKPELAVRRLEDLTKSSPKNAQAWLALGEILQVTGAGQEKVRQAIEQAVQVAPSEIRPRVLLVELLLKSKDSKAAIAAAQSAAAAIPDSAEILSALGRAQAANGEYNQAIATFNKLSVLLPKSPAPYMLIAGAQVANKEAKSAVQSLGKALEIQPDFLPAQRALAELLMQNRQTEQALVIGKTVQKQKPGSPAGFVLEGDVLAASRQWDGAATAYRSALKVSAASPEVAIKLHSVLVAAGKASEADRWADDWEKAHPKDVTMVMYRGDRAIAAGDLAVAAKLYDRVVAVQPGNALALNNLAWLAGQQGRSDAVALAERANAIAPNQPAFMDTLAMLLLAKGETAKALGVEKQVVSMKPDVMVFKLNLAKIYAKSGDKAAASKLLDELASLGDRFSGKDEVLRLRSELK